MKTILQFFLIFIFFISVLKTSYSQDIIILKNGDEVQSKVLEVSTDIVKYKKWDNQDGPIYTSSKVEIFMIKYQNGTKDVFNTSPPTTPVPPADNSGQIVGIARNFMDSKITSESKGACKLVDFVKVNGVQRDFMGQKIYTLEYRLRIDLLRDFWKASKDKWLGAEWYWDDFRVLNQKGDVYAETWESNYKFYKAGTKIEITGEIEFENTDNGWRVSGVSTFSPGYDNKSFKEITTTPTSSNTQSNIKQPAEALPLDTGYVGDRVDGKKEGKGKMVYQNGGIYEGEWKNDKRDGFGKMIYKTGSSYEGGWKDDKIDGIGTIADKDGSYSGNFVNNQKHGIGTIYDKSGEKVCEVNYKDGKLDGFNIYIINNDEEITSLEGVWANGKLNGQGTYKNINKKDNSVSTFTGEFKQTDWYNGILTTEYPDGSKTTTEIKDGVNGKTRKEK
jgi:hypothetical protein